MALWKISDVWMELSMPGTLERNGITNELALAVNPSLVIVRVSTYGQYGKEEYLGRPGYDAIAQAYGGMMNLTGDPAGPPQRAKTYTGDYVTALTGWAATMMALWEVKNSGRGQVVDLAQFEAVAQTNGNTLPLYTGEGACLRTYRKSLQLVFSPMTRSNAATAGFILPRLAARFMTGCPNSSDLTRSILLRRVLERRCCGQFRKGAGARSAGCASIAPHAQRSRSKPS